MATKPKTVVKPKGAAANEPAKAPTPAKPKEEVQNFVFVVLSPVRVGGKRREVGEQVELTMDVAQPLLDAKAISTDVADEAEGEAPGEGSTDEN